MVPIFFSKSQKSNFGRRFYGNEKKYEKAKYTVHSFGPLDEFHGFIQICYYECPHISGIYLESLLIPKTKKTTNKIELSWASGFNLSIKEMLFEGADRQQTTMNNCLSYQLP